MPSDPSKAIWYYADGDVERGPVTETQIRMLIGTGNLGREDLVWKEGMDDWTAAGRVPGLFEKQAADKGKPAAKSPKKSKPAAEAVPSAAGGAPARAARMPPLQLTLDPSKPTELLRFTAFAGQPLLVFGLLVVLLMRGCDAVGARYAGRLQARFQVAEHQFRDGWEDQKRPLERRRQELLDKDPQTTEDQEELERIRTLLDELNETKSAEQERLRNEQWRELYSASRDAGANQEMWRFWREGGYWFGLLCFSFGLLIIGFTGKGAQRWMCLVILAVVVFAVLTGGSSWEAPPAPPETSPP